MSDQITLFDRDSDYLESEVIGNSDTSASFRVHASLIYKLGESLIADEITALSELIKNAYDADATLCMLSIDSTHIEEIDGVSYEGIIELSDNGCGMDLSTIINGWLTLSNSPKKKMKKENRTTPKFHRYPLGDKGLGRLSVQKLGRNMQMVTKAGTSNIEYTVIIPWGDFLKNTTIDQIPVQIFEKDVANDKSYTKIAIRGLIDKDRWADEAQVNMLSSSISKIVSPFRKNEHSFKVIAKINGQEIEAINTFFDELLLSARAKHQIVYSQGKAVINSEYKNTFFYSRDVLSKVTAGEFTLSEAAMRDFLKTTPKLSEHVKPCFSSGIALLGLDELIIEDLYVLPDSNQNSLDNSLASSNFDHVGNGDPGDFICELYEYSLDSKYLDYLYENLSYNRLIDRDEYREFVLRFHGVKVERDGFIIQGFGEGDGGDWLGLSSSSKTTGNFFDLRNDSVIGCVYLTGSKNAVLKETTNREGFVEDEYFYAFKKILSNSIGRINRNRKKLNDSMKTYITNSTAFSGNPSENALSFRPTIENIREDISKTALFASQGKAHLEAAFHNYQVAKESVESVMFAPPEAVENLDALYENIEVVSKEYSRLIEERNSLSNKLDAINLDFEKMNERLQDLFELAGLGISVELFAHEFDSAIRNVKTKNQKIIETQATATVENLIKHINYVTFALDALRKQMSYFNPGLKYVRAEKQVFSIREFLENHQSFYTERCKKKNISFTVNILTDFQIKINRGMLNQVFDNLFSNSEYWLDFSQQRGLMDGKEYTISVEERGIVLVWDNGIGISRDIESRLFDPFESKKQNGRGLGLYIAANNLKYNSAKIRLLNERNISGNLFKFEIDLSQITQ